MLNTLFSGIFSSTTQTIAVPQFLLCIAVALVIGIFLAAVYSYKTKYTKSFVVTLALLPAVVCVVIMMVNGNVGAGVAVAGAFSLVRFRSVPGTAKEIGTIFLAMGAGLICGMGYLGYAVLFSLILGIAMFILNKVNIGADKRLEQDRILKITIPEDLNYTGAFDDFNVCQNYPEIPTICPVDSNGVLTEEAGQFAGLTTDEANKKIAVYLDENGYLFALKKIIHQYPHCWRCKTPILFRATDQWFCSVEDFKDKACEAIDSVKWIPAWGHDRITNMVKERKDWCISRQRKWGVPIPIFFCKECGEAHIDNDAMMAVADLFEKEGSNAWYSHTAAEILPEGTKCKKCGCTEFEKEKDIMDVWFDSGSSHAAVISKRDNLKFPADLYLEGNDQYRGWFQSSLLTSVATEGVAPYKAVLTHGMILDEEKRKMSKSLGNGISPQDVTEKYGADVLRLWVSSTDYQSDVHISNEILKQISESYRKIRNTARYILGNVYDFNPDTDSVPVNELMPMDKWAIVKLNELIAKVKQAYDNYEFHQVYHSIRNFCVIDMSNFYLDVLKDRLYTEKSDSKSRKAAQTAIYIILNAMTRMISPILAYTSDEIWKYMPHSSNENAENVIFNEMPNQVEIETDADFMSFWDEIHQLRDDVKKSLEVLIKDKTIKSSLEAKVTLKASGEKLEFLKKAEPELAAAFIVSAVEIAENGGELEIAVDKAIGEKCERCWIISETVGTDSEHPHLCKRCCSILK